MVTITLPSSPAELLAKAISPAMDLLPRAMDTSSARVIMATISQQESGLRYRSQVVAGGGKGPARGLYQFEQGGGCKGVLNHDASRFWMVKACEALGCPPLPSSLWSAIEKDDVLASVAARLLLFTDPKRLPDDDEKAAWDLYSRVWRPGKPRPETWAGYYVAAQSAVYL